MMISLLWTSLFIWVIIDAQYVINASLSVVLSKELQIGGSLTYNARHYTPYTSWFHLDASDIDICSELTIRVTSSSIPSISTALYLYEDECSTSNIEHFKVDRKPTDGIWEIDVPCAALTSYYLSIELHEPIELIIEVFDDIQSGKNED